MRIKEQKFGKLAEADRLQIAALLVKAGYTVRIGKEMPNGKKTYEHYIEFEER